MMQNNYLLNISGVTIYCIKILSQYKNAAICTFIHLADTFIQSDYVSWIVHPKMKVLTDFV